MNRLNLIPIHRRRAKARRARVRAWTIGVGAYATALAIAGAAVYLATAVTAQAPSKDLAGVNQQLERINLQLAGMHSALAEAQITLASAKAVSDQPDWSLLLAVVSDALGDSVVLGRCDLTPMKEEPPAAPPASPPTSPIVQTVNLTAKAVTPVTPRFTGVRVMLHVSGMGRSQAAVAAFVLRLENTDLFERVNLLQTSRQQLMAGEAVGFDLDCPLKGRTGGTP